jgi:molecular chaperone GrpE
VTEDGPQSPATVEEPAGAEAESEELVERLASAEDRYRRALADLDNLRKRTAREIERRVEESRESLLGEWLEALDSVERALSMTPEGPVQEGLRSVLDQMDAILTRQGVHRIGRPGEPFDPTHHDAGRSTRSPRAKPERTTSTTVRSGTSSLSRTATASWWAGSNGSPGRPMRCTPCRVRIASIWSSTERRPS